MFKRVTWLTVGFGLGVGASVAGARAVKKQVDRYQPNAVVDRLTDSVAALRDQVKAAVDDGRLAAREREIELRAKGPGSERDAR
jgi:outer membrane murein-binding lipoprotein Lpp